MSNIDKTIFLNLFTFIVLIFSLFFYMVQHENSIEDKKIEALGKYKQDFECVMKIRGN